MTHQKLKVALIGANGQLGTDISIVLGKDSGYDLIPLTRKEIDITNFSLTKKVLTGIKPDMVINTAAYHKVDEVEDNPDKAFLVNASAQQNLAKLCSKHGWTIVYISTDYVFGQDKKRQKPYTEADMPGPVNIYGMSKLAGEQITHYLNPKHFVLRVCGLHGVVGAAGKGSNFVETMIRLGKEKGAVKVVNDQILSPTYTLNIAQNMAGLLKTKHFGLFHMVSSNHCSWYQFANQIFRLMKMRVKCEPVSTSAFPTRAIRPAYSVLANSNLQKIGLNYMRTWQENLKLYLAQKGHIT